MKNIILIGMPSSGKTTIGQLAAGELDMNFIDTDAVILEKSGKPLRDIVKEDGLQKFLEIQEKAILGLQLHNHVVATGGSVVYGAASMEHLKKEGFVVFLRSTFEEIEQRVTPDRRFARNDGQSLYDLYKERMPLYEKYSDAAVDCSGKQPEDIAAEIVKYIKNFV